MAKNLEFNKNEDACKLLLGELHARLKKVQQGGGEKKAARERGKGKLLARERIDHLIDKDSNFLEAGALAAEGMYEEYGGSPSAGVVTGSGQVSGRLRSEEHTSELQSLMRISYAVFCLINKKKTHHNLIYRHKLVKQHQ